ncbi:hypothetical protein SCLCIDRAFT_1210323 [Scleroderma citrinum Foug A]|uniref:DUF221-domain-containing protein n=1 Tax=Scleroderma citrinum Foug A TaxID=1036808 RepID=A0A0C3E3A9_9AGAM|nr:hypothetical protein SCLCIDRAFT_1210323 [Scleroderma citrinum Foug A]
MSQVSQDQAQSASTETFLTALVFNAAVFGAEIVAFTILRRYFKQIYEPRTVHPHSKGRVKPFEAGILTWPIRLLNADSRDIQRVNGPDAYLFVRFLRMMIVVFVPIWVVSWIILLPVTAVNNSVAGKTGLDRFTFGNISPYNQPRYGAYVACVYLSTFWVYWNIRREMRHFLTVRQLHLIDPAHSRSSQANTILVTGIPSKYLSEKALAQLYSHLPGGVKKIWLNRDLGDLPSIYDRRLAACGKLESAETNLLRTALKIRKKNLKQGKRTDGVDDADQAERDVALAERLVPKDRRPTHRLPAGFLPFSLPFIGEKVDTIDWSRNEISECSALLRTARQTADRESNIPALEDKDDDGRIDRKDLPTQTYRPLNSAFVTFNQQLSAHLAYHALTHHEPYRMADRYLEVSPEDVIWGNLGLNPYEKRVRMAISYAATAALIIFWAIPVAFVGIISNIHGLCVRYSWLAWLCKIPAPIIGIIQGILPAVLLAVLNMLLPIVLRLFGRFQGIPTRTGLELSLMTRFFIFQVIHSFLIVTLSSGIIAALPALLKNPSSAASLLASYLPQASTFFLTYILLQGLSGAAGGFLGIVQLAIYYVKLFILGSTPRSIYDIKFGPRTVQWGTLFPVTTLLTVITLGYSIISPIINGLSVLTFFLFFLLYKYLFLYQYTQPPNLDTGGLFFPKAIQHVFVGLYVQQICLCALFFLAEDASGKHSAVAEGALMVVLILLTAGYQIIINNSFGPLISALPLSLADKTHKPDEASPSDAQPSTSADPAYSKQSKAAELAKDDQEEEEARDFSDNYFQKHPDGDVDYGFAHPALSRPQRVVWIPTDLDAWASASTGERHGARRGLGGAEVEANLALGILATNEGAMMDEKGNVEILAAPVDVDKF